MVCRSDGVDQIALGGLEKERDMQGIDPHIFSRAPPQAMERLLKVRLLNCIPLVEVVWFLFSVALLLASSWGCSRGPATACPLLGRG
jgi:hypothetical protein